MLGAIVLGTIIINVTDPFLPMEWSQLAAGQGEFYIKVCARIIDAAVDLASPGWVVYR